MSDARAALDIDRLPWLADERKPRRKRGWGPLLLWALVAAMLIASISYWLGMRSVDANPAADRFVSAPPAATIKLPEPAMSKPVAEEVELAPQPEVAPVREPAPVTIVRSEPARLKAKPKRIRSPIDRPVKARAPVEARPAAKTSSSLKAWPAAVSAGAYGRVARIGTFSSRRQAKQGWWQIVRHYPGMRRLKAVVAPVPSLRNGRTYYRLQFGTTSQAHSEVLCQRMRIIGQSCVVVGLPPASGARK